MTIDHHQYSIPAAGGDDLFVATYHPAGADPAEIPTLVFSHGAGGSHLNWFHQVAEFAHDHHVVLWDHRGFGRSTNRSDLASPRLAANDLEAVLDTVGIDQAYVVAQSMGGWGALQYAMRCPQRVRGLVLADTCAGLLSTEIEARLDRFIEESAAGRATSEFLNSRAVGPMFARHNHSAAVLYHMLTAAMPSYYPTAVRDIRNTPIRGDYTTLDQVPILAIVGEHDQIFPPDVLRTELAPLPRVHFEVIPDAGHSPYFEQPKKFNDALRRFLVRASLVDTTAGTA